MALDPYLNTPVGSLAAVTDGATDAAYISTIHRLPPLLLTMISSEKTGAYIIGMARTYNIPTAAAPVIAFAVLRVALGELTLAQLASALSTDLKLANDVAQKMAAELEHDLFAPVAVELNQFLTSKKQQPAAGAANAARQAGASNVLNLKNKQKPPTPPEIPRPVSRNPGKDLPRL